MTLEIRNVLAGLQSGRISFDQALTHLNEILEYRKDLIKALDERDDFWRACRAHWPRIQRGEVDTLKLLIYREFVSLNALYLFTKTGGDTTIKVWISRLRKYTQTQIINDYGKGYRMVPEDRKRLKQLLESKHE